jgi:tRNA (guanine37-N1)-methyltransferase
MVIDVITPFPRMIEAFMSESILKRARTKGAAEIAVWDLRDFTNDKHRSVDDAPYGGGAGMILKPEPFFRAVEHIRGLRNASDSSVLLMSPQGETYSQAKAKALSTLTHLVILCGHYRGVDERVIQELVTDEISIGDYVLTGGELAAAVVMDSVVRLLPGVLGNADSADGDSFACGKLDHPHYTRPEEFRGLPVPEVLVSGHHAKVKIWRDEEALKKTRQKRPDLLEAKEKAQGEVVKGKRL